MIYIDFTVPMGLMVPPWACKVGTPKPCQTMPHALPHMPRTRRWFKLRRWRMPMIWHLAGDMVNQAWLAGKSPKKLVTSHGDFMYWEAGAFWTTAAVWKKSWRVLRPATQPLFDYVWLPENIFGIPAMDPLAYSRPGGFLLWRGRTTTRLTRILGRPSLHWDSLQETLVFERKSDGKTLISFCFL